MLETYPQRPASALAVARQEAEQRLLPGPQLEVRRTRCSLCWALPLDACQRYPRGDHLQRWLDAATAGSTTKAELAATVSLVVVVKASQVIPDTAVLAVVAVLAAAGVAVVLLVHAHRSAPYDAAWDEHDLAQALPASAAQPAAVVHQHLHLHGVTAADVAAITAGQPDLFAANLVQLEPAEDDR